MKSLYSIQISLWIIALVLVFRFGGPLFRFALILFGCWLMLVLIYYTLAALFTYWKGFLITFGVIGYVCAFLTVFEHRNSKEALLMLLGTGLIYLVYKYRNKVIC